VVAGTPAAAALRAAADKAKSAEVQDAEAEDLEVLDDAEPLEEVEDAEVLDDAEPLEAAEVLDDAEPEPLGALDEAEPAEVLDEAEDLEILDDAEPLEALDDTEPAEPPAKKSNIQLVLGEDDIPYIAESSGIELVDDLDIPGSVQDADGIEELEDLEELGEEEIAAEAPSKENAPQATDIASQIEFGTSTVEEKEESTNDDLEIASPFATILSRFDKNSKTSGLEELGSDGMSMVYKPFQAEETSSPELIQAADASVIKEKDGVNYINEKVKTPDSETEKKLDPGLKNLVDSIIKKK
jgi:hypothetical protein